MPKFIKKKTVGGSALGGRKFVVRAVRPKARKSSREVLHQKADNTLDSLNSLLEKDEKTKKVLENRDLEENAIFVDDPDSFDGVSDSEEAEMLFDSALSYERKKTKSIEDRIKSIEQEKDNEKEELIAQIRELKRELHRTAPLHDTKFFSLSKELKTAIEDLERVAGSVVVSQPVTTQMPRESPLPAEAFVEPAKPVAPVQKTVVKPVEPVKSAPEPAPKEMTEAEKKSLSKKKVLVTGAGALVLIFGISAAAGMFLSQPKVDEALVAQYLPQAGQVQGAQTGDSGGEKSDQPDPSQADVTFEQTVWDDYKDASFGIMLQYPKNAVKVVRTDSNITFIRKTGYLFKVQRVETSFTADEYWKQIKSTSLNYVSTSEKFKGKVALKLELEDMTDYPGDRYLIKEGEFIYDVWYATPSNNFTGDDIKLAEKMLASLSIVEATEF